MNYQSLYYPETRFGGFTIVDGTLAFYTRIHALSMPASVVLDVGCGRGVYAEDPVRIRREARILRGRCRRVIGIDVDRAAQANPFVDEFRLVVDGPWPVEEESVDLCLCDWVLEHVEDPEAFFRECRRVLKPGGYLCIRTPNVWNYVGLISRCLPNRLHREVLERAQAGRQARDVFPTYYRCNTVRRIRRLLDQHRFRHHTYAHEAEPCYLSFSRWAYRMGVLHQRFAPRILRSTLMVFAEKQ